MKQGPNPNEKFPLEGYNKLCFLKNIVDHPQIEIGDYTYYDDHEDVNNFLKSVKYNFDFIDDKLIIGKFCSIASGVQFLLNGGNHLTSGISSFPFAIFGNGWEGAMEGKEYPVRGNIEIGNDVWIGHEAVILPGVKVGDGCIIGAQSVVSKDMEPYTIAAGNPAKTIRKRFSESEIESLLEIQWWNWPIETITANIQNLTAYNIDALKAIHNQFK
ncbi:CatB-related O-acetyltransferase [Roseivirga sp.]|uniref:CatB-related O-acetyltransferase n=1 Tax=Roseivirga sp. TaxID=1964215 RepID=UPI003B51550E